MKCKRCRRQVQPEDIEEDGHWYYEEGIRGFCNNNRRMK